MAFKGITFAGQNVTPKNDGGLYQAHYGDGILWGCSMAISGDDLVIQSGEFIAGGRACQVDGATPIDLSVRQNANEYIQVYMEYDISQPEGTQWNPRYRESQTLVFGALTQEDINNNGNIYQVEIAVVQVASGNLQSVYRTMPHSPVTAFDNFFIDDGTNQLEGYINTNGSGIRGLVGYGSNQGLYFPATGFSDAILYGNGGDIYVRPNGLNDDTSRFTFYANGDFRINGQMLGGTSLETGNALVTSVGAGQEVTVAKVTAGLASGGKYMVYGYFGGTPANSNSGSTDMEIFVDGTRYRIHSIYSNAAVAKYTTMNSWVAGATTSIELKVWASSQHAWNNIVAQLQVVRIA